MEDYFNEELNERLCKSASETLDRYIQNYEMKRSREMARSLRCTRTSDKLLRSLSKDVSALDEEILLAKNMFADDTFDLSEHDRSLTTEELLMEHSFNQSFNVSSSEHLPGRSDEDERMQCSELDVDPENYHVQPLRKHVRSSSSLSTNDNTHPNLKSLQKFLHHGKFERFRPETNVPSAKYNRSQISSEDIKGELTVSMNYLPQKRLRMTKYDYSNDYVGKRFECDGKDKSHETEVHRFDHEATNNADEDGLITVSLQIEGKPASVREFMGECFSEESVKNTSSNDGQRTVESLKNMLFSLQQISTQAKNELETGEQYRQGSQQEDAPGCESLEKAMKHLVILKKLVKEVGRTEKHNNS